jgi:Na+/melibiose symporter-like transporter
MEDDMRKQQDKSLTTGLALFLMPHLFCCTLLAILLLSGFSLNLGSPIWLIMGGVLIASGVSVFLWCAKRVYSADQSGETKKGTGF